MIFRCISFSVLFFFFEQLNGVGSGTFCILIFKTIVDASEHFCLTRFSIYSFVFSNTAFFSILCFFFTQHSTSMQFFMAFVLVACVNINDNQCIATLVNKTPSGSFGTFFPTCCNFHFIRSFIFILKFFIFTTWTEKTTKKTAHKRTQLFHFTQKERKKCVVATWSFTENYKVCIAFGDLNRLQKSKNPLSHKGAHTHTHNKTQIETE